MSSAATERKFQRYYFHGDRTEQDPSLVFCAKCDSFEQVGHFYERDAHAWSSHTDYERYLYMKRAFEKKSCPLRDSYQRPAGAENIFA